jgi:hypothetical protein
MLVTCFFSTPVVSQACSPAPPDPWFTERISIAAADLPSDVAIRVLQITRYGITRDYVEITNRSPTPLYIVGRIWTSEKTFDPLPLSLPSGVGPTHKVLSQQAFTWRPIFDTTHSQARMGWIQGTIERPDAVLLSIGHNTLMSDQGNVVELAPRNQTGDDRPADTQLPAPQTVRFPLVSGTELLQVPITVAYTLNPIYRPDSVARSLTACRSPFFPAPGLWLVIVVVSGCVGMVWLGYRRWVARRSKNAAA